MIGRNPAIIFVIEGLTGARAVDGVRIGGSGQAVIDELGGRGVGQQAGLRIYAGGTVEDDIPAGRKLFLASNADTGLLQVVSRQDESRSAGVAVHQRCAFIVIAVFGQAVADPAYADVIRAIHRDAVQSQRAIGGQEFVAAGAGVGAGRNRPSGLGGQDLVETGTLGAVYGHRFNLGDLETGRCELQAILAGKQLREAVHAVPARLFLASLARTPIRG